MISRSIPWVLLISMVVLAIGCRTSSSSNAFEDATVRRYAKTGRQAYAEGHVDRAVDAYRKAIQRAWAIDDPFASGSNAYNLAACLTSQSREDEALQWLVDARMELARAGASLGNVWLLEAKIAQHAGRIGDAPILIQRAANSRAPCDETTCDPESCDQPCLGCVSKIPCIGSKISERQTSQACQAEFEAQIQLAFARWSAEQYDVSTAQAHFAKACELVADLCSHDLQAELQNVAALIHIAQGDYLQAARHLDAEAVQLRLAENYREIPTALRLAAAAYEQSGLLTEAAYRLSRVARILYGRGESKPAWNVLQDALAIAESAESETIRIQLALLGQELLETLSVNTLNSADGEEVNEEETARDVENKAENPAQFPSF